ncbi:MAG TPA: type I DNA topoisomerase [Fermentimonas caenicola]|jgi:DNA topoisomerase-1|uniref:type I DNA topoisomerase n=1 Tax=Lascolabacillus TaxID=1924067 RepID=UPI0006B35AB4|nr:MULTISPECIES: type I DNA topoisomerase [Lascolabacillus]MBP6174657.1 type I DNA topoisomerase [Fermentimonas sp.]MDI9625000.1 type I DNA topoisomerase [Bacteroidota bacterium]TAH61591.1 MAG: type I DNA topoisomerase [Fermentimonas caenicola]MBP6195941.1 type I DNA topoisomerase [Fermentimonas sp.]MBP7104933.1 type I DNA topoisomerase [Fermentimonas sp.]
MEKNLVIVESPAKAKTIEKFLGKDFHVMSSYGHIRDLKKKDFSIDVENNFEPIYEVPDDKKKIVSELKAAVKKANTVWLASDEDREGEAISWHLFETLELKEENTKRIVFHEITKNAILEAIKNPRKIDKNLVDAQQARRVLDRIVGFELSPVLWRKIKPALSAGRVQSVAVRLIVEREREIQNFNSEASYRVVGVFSKVENGQTYEIKAEYNKRLKTKEEALELLEKLKSSVFSIEDVVTRPAKKSPAAPFTTSTLQQEASRKLGFSVGQTMMVAQRLYESGKITYMRTDSVNLSGLAIGTAKTEVIDQYGEKYHKSRQYSTKSKGAQEAHEAIRPTYISEHEIEGTAQEKKLYNLIWKRTIASQMADVELERTTANISVSNTDGKFVANGEVIKFDGFLRVYLEGTDDENGEKEDGILPPVKKGEVLEMQEVSATERFSQRPARYSEASLVRKMEELGIGRPSTYAPTISTIINREYVEKKSIDGEKRNFNVLLLKKGKIKDSEKTETTGADKNKLFPTDIGIVVNDFLVEYFPSIIDYNFTAKVEEGFDKIAEGKAKWNKSISDFYDVFHPIVEETANMRMEHKAGERVLGVDPKSGRQVSVKIGRYGAMAQIGTPEEDEKPLFASLQKSQSIESITLEETLKLFELPRNIGEFRDKDVVIGIGRFGPYIRHNNKFVSIPKGVDPLEIQLEEAIELIEDKERKDKEKTIKLFEEDSDLQVLNGRYGPYIKYQNSNYKIPKTTDPKKLTLEECKRIIEDSAKDKKSKSKKTKKSESAESSTTKKGTSKTADKGKTKTAKATSTKKTTGKRSTKK